MLDLAASALLLRLLALAAAAALGMLCSEASPGRLVLLEGSGWNSTKRFPGLQLLPRNNHIRCQY
jgi:hypothetical protein